MYAVEDAGAPMRSSGTHTLVCLSAVCPAPVTVGQIRGSGTWMQLHANTSSALAVLGVWNKRLIDTGCGFPRACIPVPTMDG